MIEVQGRIKTLSTLLANQIAAGEVVERPASVVKELVENAIDAGAKKIDVELEQGGTMLIRVQDDGFGIEKSDLVLAVSPHATSKIASTEDLAAIASLGFRGEALASIASVSQFSLTSKHMDADLAWRIECEGHHQIINNSPAALPKGTVVEVRNLFFNTPARRKFLRAPKTELTHIEELINRLALSTPEVSITLKHQGRVIKRFHSAQNKLQLEKRIALAIEPKFIQSAQQVDIVHENLTIKGWVGSSQYTRSQTDGQFIFINGRLVKDRTLTHAAKEAFHGVIADGRQPSYVLYLELDPAEVDVNVHPTKHEVRFSQPRIIHDLLASTVHNIVTQDLDSISNNQLLSDSNSDRFQNEHLSESSDINEDARSNQVMSGASPKYQESARSLHYTSEKRMQSSRRNEQRHQVRDQAIYQEFYQSLSNREVNGLGIERSLNSQHTPNVPTWFLTELEQILVFKSADALIFYDKFNFIHMLWKHWQSQNEKGVKPFMMPILVDCDNGLLEIDALQLDGFCMDWLDSTEKKSLRLLGVPHFFENQQLIDWQELIIKLSLDGMGTVYSWLLNKCRFDPSWLAADWFSGVNIEPLVCQTADSILSMSRPAKEQS
jgi:DNA mismatch repair protein MutL